jgi:hypothetical protein
LLEEKMRGFAVAVAALGLMAGTALAASPMGQLKDIDGKVYVNRGKGFVLAQGDTELFQGDRVMVGEKGSATVNYYLAECDVMLTASTMTTIPSRAPCKGGSTTSVEGAPFSESTGGQIVVGLGAAAIITTGIVVATGDDDGGDDDEPTSP